MALAPSLSPPMVLVSTGNMVECTDHLHERRRRVTLVHSKTAPARLESMARADYTHGKKNKKKSVRFDGEQLEQVRLFLKTQAPSDIHNGDPPSPLSGRTIELKYPNWPEKTVIRLTPPPPAMIRIENVRVASNSDASAINLVGRCRVANLAFQKHVVVRYTTDYWQSFHETEAMYHEPIGSSANTWDRFSFQIELDPVHPTIATTTTTTLYLALRYTVNNIDYWDSNDGLNYQIDVIVRDNDARNEDCQEVEEEKEMISDHDQYLSPRQLLLPMDKARQGKKQLIRVVDSKAPSEGLASVSPRPSPTGTRPISKTKLSTPALIIEPLKHVVVAKKKQLGLRYDFGASLSAAKKVVSSGKIHYQHPFVGRPLFDQQHHVAPAAEAGNDDDDFLQLRYRDIIAKYCFYGNSTAPTTTTTTPPRSPCSSPEPICG